MTALLGCDERMAQSSYMSSCEESRLAWQVRSHEKGCYLALPIAVVTASCCDLPPIVAT